MVCIADWAVLHRIAHADPQIVSLAPYSAPGRCAEVDENADLSVSPAGDGRAPRAGATACA